MRDRHAERDQCGIPRGTSASRRFRLRFSALWGSARGTAQTVKTFSPPRWYVAGALRPLLVWHLPTAVRAHGHPARTGDDRSQARAGRSSGATRRLSHSDHPQPETEPSHQTSIVSPGVATAISPENSRRAACRSRSVLSPGQTWHNTSWPTPASAATFPRSRALLSPSADSVGTSSTKLASARSASAPRARSTVSGLAPRRRYRRAGDRRR